MTVSTLAGYQAAARQRIVYRKNATTWGGSAFYSNVQIGGSPGAPGGPGNTANGIIPIGGTTGFPALPIAFDAIYIAGVEASLNSSDSRFGGYRYVLADLLWYGGAYTSASSVTLSAQPSFAARVPSGDYAGLQLWSEGVGAGSGTTTLAVTYTNQSGTTARSTGATDINPSSLSSVAFEGTRFPLQSGDCGLQKIESVTGAGGGSCTANLMILRPLVYGRVDWTRNKGVQRKWFDRANAPVIYPDSALMTLVASEGSPTVLTTAAIELQLELATLQTVATPTVWNPYDKDSTATLYNGYLTATGGKVRANVSHSSGKYYFEARLDAGPVSSAPYIAIRQTAAAVGAAGGPFGAGTDYGCFARSPNDGHQDYVPGSNTFTVGPALAVGDIYMFAVDLSAGKLWIGRNGTWDNSGNPAAGTNAVVASGISGAYSPWADTGNVTVSARFASSAWTYSAPSGFSQW